MNRLPSLLLTAALLAVGCAPSITPVVAGPELASSAGFPLPSITLERLDGTGSVDTRDLVGQPIVLNVWATWCAYCVEEMPDIEAVHVELGDRVRFLGVDRADDAAMARELAARTGVTYELLADPDSELFEALGTRAMPTTVLVDAAGRVVHRHAGPLEQAQLRALILEHLGI
ncbi:MAG TPA: TlpA disulfide reductase family protein [Nitriliruptorales bacterium]